MQGWQLTNTKKIEEVSRGEVFDSSFSSKVKVTKALITEADYLRFNGEIDAKGVILGSYGAGVISEPCVNLYNLTKGSRVYISPKKPCENCYNCKNDDYQHCANLRIAGENYDGFLRDFMIADKNDLYFLPDSVSDEEALFIDYLSVSLKIIDDLNIEKGEYVAVVSDGILGNVLSQLLIYYQSVPIFITGSEEEKRIAKQCGVYYSFSKKDNYTQELFNITGGRMAKSVVYVANDSFTPHTAFSLAAAKSNVAITGSFLKKNSFTFTEAIKKDLTLKCINSGYGNTEACINLLANKAISLNKLNIERIKLSDINNAFEKMNKTYEEENTFVPIIVDLVEIK